jgi:hypothetical protein
VVSLEPSPHVQRASVARAGPARQTLDGDRFDEAWSFHEGAHGSRWLAADYRNAGVPIMPSWLRFVRDMDIGVRRTAAAPAAPSRLSPRP